MSYILDALKKAEAERRQDKAPGLDAQPLPLPAAPRHTAARLQLPYLLGIAAGAALLFAAAWYKPWQAGTVAVPAAPQSLPAPAPAAAVQAPAAAPPPPMEMPPPPRQASVQKSAPPAAANRAASAPAPGRQERAQSRRPAESPARPPAPVSSATTAENLPTLRELPESIQRELPELQVGGYLYADKAADRSVLINKRLLHEGDEVAPGVTLERMQPNGMILRYREHRFRISY
ncbi:MAG TPA: general secretion pathway protein GspB [Paucimonas sp.]|nr:general secretion pathway protein GspB [Paucimonas sp.]